MGKKIGKRKMALMVEGVMYELKKTNPKAYKEQVKAMENGEPYTVNFYIKLHEMYPRETPHLSLSKCDYKKIKSK